MPVFFRFEDVGCRYDQANFFHVTERRVGSSKGFHGRRKIHVGIHQRGIFSFPVPDILVQHRMSFLIIEAFQRSQEIRYIGFIIQLQCRKRFYQRIFIGEIIFHERKDYIPGVDIEIRYTSLLCQRSAATLVGIVHYDGAETVP